MIEARQHDLLGPGKIAALEAWMGRGCTIDRVELLSCGSIQQYWLLVGTVDAKPFAWVL
ncbi:MAG: hypothetical protein IAI50_18505, partial [Candidatus Eremiobacteraeota bacterium]|nr:hypothetical protein [Candidatus Eremiobacteraeota bacterium]